MPLKIILNPTEKRIFQLQYENCEPETIEAFTFQEALAAWWFDFGPQENDVEVELGSVLSGIMTFWFLAEGVQDGWRQITLQDITDEWRGLQSGNLISCEGLVAMRRKRPRVIERQAEAEAQSTAELQAELLAKYRNLMTAMGK